MANTVTRARLSKAGQVVLFELSNGDIQGMATTGGPGPDMTPDRIVEDIKSGALPAFLNLFHGDPAELTQKTLAANSDWETVYEA